ncbi:MAG: class I SAM-dependent methyltransferase [Promethearchaeota archaeon]
MRKFKSIIRSLRDLSQRIYINSLFSFLSYIAGIKLWKEVSKCKNLEDLSILARYCEITPFRGSRFKIVLESMQVKSEIIEFLKKYLRHNPKYILEIGTAKGGTLFLLTHLAVRNSKIISLDLPGGEFGAGYPRYKIPFYKNFARNNRQINLIRGNSHHPLSKRRVLKKLKGNKLDVLFIDGDHTYDGAKKDFTQYKSLLRKGGMIIFHDIVVHPKESNCDVNSLWNELKLHYEYKEFVEDWNQLWGGIGILYV